MRFLYNKYGLFALFFIFMNYSLSCNKSRKEISRSSKGGLKKDLVGFKIVDGDTIYVGDFVASIMKDSVEFYLIDSLDAVSYDGKQGYIIKAVSSNNTEICIIDLKSKEILKKRLISDIVKESELQPILTSDSSTYHFYYSIERVFSSNRGLVIQEKWSPGYIYSNSSRIFLFLNKHLQIEKVAAYQDIQFSDPSFCIDYDDSVYFTLDSRIVGAFYFNKKRYTQDYVNWPGDKDLYDFISFNTYYIDSSRNYISNMDSTIKLSTNLIVPRLILNNRFIYFHVKHNRQRILLYNLANRKLYIYPTSGAKIKCNLTPEGMSAEYLFMKCIPYFEETLNKKKVYKIKTSLLLD